MIVGKSVPPKKKKSNWNLKKKNATGKMCFFQNHSSSACCIFWEVFVFPRYFTIFIKNISWDPTDQPDPRDSVSCEVRETWVRTVGSTRTPLDSRVFVSRDAVKISTKAAPKNDRNWKMYGSFQRVASFLGSKI